MGMALALVGSTVVADNCRNHQHAPTLDLELNDVTWDIMCVTAAMSHCLIRVLCE